MKTYRHLLTLCGIITGQFCWAQTSTAGQLVAPQSPAASILGIQPSAVERPKTYTALEGALFNNFVDQGSFAIPNDFSLEFMPFWAADDKDGKKVTIKQFLAPAPGWESIRQSLAFSVASTQAFQLNDSLNSNALGLGLRFMLMNGGRNYAADVDQKVQATMAAAIFSTRLTLVADNTVGQPGTYVLTKGDVKDIADAWAVDAQVSLHLTNAGLSGGYLYSVAAQLADTVVAKTVTIDQMSDVIQNIVGLPDHVSLLEATRDTPSGLRIQVAGALLVNYPTNEADYAFAPKMGVWVTPSWRSANMRSMEFLGVIRYLWYQSEYFKRYDTSFSSFDNNWDLGFRAIWKKGKFSLEGEVVHRISTLVVSSDFDETTGLTTTQSKEETDLQYLLNLNYQVSPTLALSYNYGKQLGQELNLNVDGDLVSLLTLNIGFGAPKVVGSEISR